MQMCSNFILFPHFALILLELWYWSNFHHYNKNANEQHFFFGTKKGVGESNTCPQKNWGDVWPLQQPRNMLMSNILFWNK